MTKAKPNTTYRFAPAHVWAEVRRDYVAGLTAAQCCAKHGVGLAGLRRRAGLEGWTKAASAAAAPEAEAPPPPRPARTGPAPIDPGGLARAALERASAALIEGRPGEAEAIMRALDLVLPVAEQFGDDDKAADELEAMIAADETRTAAFARYAERLAEAVLGGREAPAAHAEWAAAWRDMGLEGRNHAVEASGEDAGGAGLESG